MNAADKGTRPNPGHKLELARRAHTLRGPRLASSCLAAGLTHGTRLAGADPGPWTSTQIWIIDTQG